MRPIDDDAALGLVQIEVEPRALGVNLAAQKWRAPSRLIAFRSLDLHHVGAEMAEKLRRVRRSDQLAALEDANAAERSHRPSSSWPSNIVAALKARDELEFA